MSLQICLKTEKSLQQLATEICNILSLPSFKLDSFDNEPYCQFDMLGMLVLLRYTDEDERDPEVKNYSYAFDLQMSFLDATLDTDMVEYTLQPYYAQLLAFRLGIETACYEKKKVGPHWQIRYCYYCRNPKWNETILFGEPGWEPALIVSTPHAWRIVHPDL